MTALANRNGWPLRASALYDPWVRGLVYQVLLLAAVVWLVVELALNARANLEAQHIATGFGFFDDAAGFSVNQTLIPFTESNSYGRVFLVGLLNTLLVAVLGIVLTTIVGLVVGIARLSPNWLVARLAGGYVELFRNLPVLFQILFWYLAVLGALPTPRQSVSIADTVFLNNRGIIVPAPHFTDGSLLVLLALAAAIVAAFALRFWAKQRQAATGRQFPTGWASLALIVGLPLVVASMMGFPVQFELPELRGFNFVGGARLIPEFVALVLALSIYTAAFIAEIVRAGILAVSRGQTEAAAALGFRRGAILRLVVLPQAMRVIVPPLTSQYLNLTKNSTLAVAIGYPDLFAVFAGTALNQTGQAIEIIAITMAVYLAISLVTSLLMNWYNARTRLVER